MLPLSFKMRHMAAEVAAKTCRALAVSLCLLLVCACPYLLRADRSVSTDLKCQYFLNKMQNEKLPVMRRVPYIDSLERLDPSFASRHLNKKGHLYMKATRFNDALRCFEKLAKQKNLSLDERLKALYWQAWCYNATAQYSKALNTVLNIFASEKPDSLWYHDAYSYLLVYRTYDLLRQHNMAERYLVKADSVLKSRSPKSKKWGDLHLTVELYKAALYLCRGRYPEALAQCRKTQQMAVTPLDRQMADMNFAYLLEYMGEPAKAEELYNQFMQEKNEDIIYNINYESAMFNYALLLLKQKRYKDSEAICRRQIPNTFITGQKNTRGLLYEVLGRALDGQGKHKEAFDALFLSMSTLDSVRNERSTDLSDVTADFEIRMAELEQSRQSSGSRVVYWWVIAAFLAVILGAGVYSGIMIWRRNERKHKHRGVMLQRFSDAELRHCRQESKTGKELDEANRRIVSLSMKKAEADGMLASVREITAETASSPREKLNKIRTLLQAIPISDRNWEVFRTHFEKVHPHFFTNLSQRHPHLTQGDLKMAAFIVMNISTNEIASLLCRSQRTVESARYRLNKKLSLSDDLSMAEYLRTFMQQ